jgi:hypothetical protein
MSKQSKNGQSKTTIHLAIRKSTARKILDLAKKQERSLNWFLGNHIEKKFGDQVSK